MEQTSYFSLNLPEYNDPADISDLNDNTVQIDAYLYSMQGDISAIKDNIGDIPVSDVAAWYSENSEDLGYILMYADELKYLGGDYETITTVTTELSSLVDYTRQLGYVGEAITHIYDDPSLFEFDLTKLHENATMLGYIGNDWDLNTPDYLHTMAGAFKAAYIDPEYDPYYYTEDLEYLRSIHGNDSRGHLVTLVGYSVCGPLIRWSSIYSLVYDDDDKPYVELNVSDIQLFGYTWHDNMYSLKEVIEDLYSTSGGSDVNVTQTASDSASGKYELLLSGTADNTTRTEGAIKTQYATFDPHSKSLTIGNRSSSFSNGDYSIAVGSDTTAYGMYSVAIGNGAQAKYHSGVAIGVGATSEAASAIAIGYGTWSRCKSQFVFGEYNQADPIPSGQFARGDHVEIVGNGTSSSNKSNARTLDWDGNEWLAGSLSVGNSALSYSIDPDHPDVTSTNVVGSITNNFTMWDGNVGLRAPAISLNVERHEGPGTLNWYAYSQMISPNQNEMFKWKYNDEDNTEISSITLNVDSGLHISYTDLNDSSYDKGLKVTDSDIILDNGTGTWDGTHTSLRDAINSILAQLN